jgi:hypothetical protein
MADSPAKRRRRAQLRSYLDELEEELGPVTPEEQAEAAAAFDALEAAAAARPKPNKGRP